MPAENTIAIDQYGQTYHSLGCHPRKALLQIFGLTKCNKMYIDTKDGKPRHIGYIMAGLWLSIYTIKRWDK